MPWRFGRADRMDEDAEHALLAHLAEGDLFGVACRHQSGADTSAQIIDCWGLERAAVLVVSVEGSPVHAGGPFGTKYAGSEAESEEALMQTDLLLTWGVLFGTILLFAYSTTRR